MTNGRHGRSDYKALDVETLPARLANVSQITQIIGEDWRNWHVQEVGDGNLNLVFVIQGSAGGVVVKQALPYVRVVGEGWPFPLYRAFYEYNALFRQAQRDPGRVPKLYHYDDEQAMIAMEYLSPHVILRRKLINGEEVDHLGNTLGQFCARTAFRGSELSMTGADKKADLALFSGNVVLSEVTQSIVFTEPYYCAEMNHHTPELEPVVTKLRSNCALKVKVQDMLMRFASNTETMMHGDLHTGSVMVAGQDVRVIDSEFAHYGPMGFDLGMLMANYLMAYFSQPAHRTGRIDGPRCEAYQAWILSVIDETLVSFDATFQTLWQNERQGVLYPKSLFEDQGHSSAPACASVLALIHQDAAAVCGIEMHRRFLSLAHNADFEEIENTRLRAELEARNIMMGCELIEQSCNAADITALAQEFNQRDFL